MWVTDEKKGEAGNNIGDHSEETNSGLTYFPSLIGFDAFVSLVNYRDSYAEIF